MSTCPTVLRLWPHLARRDAAERLEARAWAFEEWDAFHAADLRTGAAAIRRVEVLERELRDREERHAAQLDLTGAPVLEILDVRKERLSRHPEWQNSVFACSAKAVPGG